MIDTDPDFDIKEPELDYDRPIGEKPWPLRLAIPAMLKKIWWAYMWICTLAVTIFLIVGIFK